eukprot:scaffold7398_cov277-Pinguiococcus_pyrenoidosus.AAC.4
MLVNGLLQPNSNVSRNCLLGRCLGRRREVAKLQVSPAKTSRERAAPGTMRSFGPFLHVAVALIALCNILVAVSTKKAAFTAPETEVNARILTQLCAERRPAP